MELHVKFKPNHQRSFLFEVAHRSNLSVNKLAKLAEISAKNYRDWKREKISMRLKAAKILSQKFCVKLPEKTEIMVSRWRKARQEAAQIGGLACFRKYGCPATFSGRSKGGKKALYILRKKGIIPEAKKFNLPAKLSVKLAEFIGILLGDGSLTPAQVQVTLNANADKNYIPFVITLGNQLFGEIPRVIKRKNINAVVIYYSGINLVKYLTKIGLKIGNKVKQQVDIPTWIKSSTNYQIACLRGLMDTDGGVFLHKYKVNRKIYLYKKICFSNRSLPLLYFVNKTLKRLGFTPKLIDKVENKKVWLYNKKEVEKYLKVVGTHNPRLLKYQNV
ncbi:MAG TPA: LAGLIDADG family homing endonuclease [Candidatus Bathyarchaeia archaeon]|nr:LAGLIDADG family homing endonuclease [Candidatus Bathyarchaeia archaeon]